MLRRSIIQSILILGVSSLFLGFQNCGQQVNFDTGEIDAPMRSIDINGAQVMEADRQSQSGEDAGDKTANSQDEQETDMPVQVSNPTLDDEEREELIEEIQIPDPIVEARRHG